MYCVIVSFLSDDMAKIVLKSCETCNAFTLLHTPAGDVWPQACDPDAFGKNVDDSCKLT